ncbi:hypothetical protein V496_02147 [Pseudogymnoascus sp. VKM F-4515 (FW-2607)]|nr:hypothetical protein V496_02147 [Pseudogymnoascus sp. VKM F-4515 (FW-2607)]
MLVPEVGGDLRASSREGKAALWPTAYKEASGTTLREHGPHSRIYEAERTSRAIFTDGSARNGLIGVGATWQSSDLRLTGAHHHFEHVVQEDDWTGCWETISSTADNNEYAAELLAILKALQSLNTQATQGRPQDITILSDCKSAIISIQKPRYQSGQYILKRIWRVAAQLRKQGTYITLQWTPAHEGVIGNEKAHKWAQTATKKGAKPTGSMFRQLKSRTLQAGRQLIQGQTIDKFDSMRFGRFTRNLDKALPGTHMRAIYNQLQASEARILVQLRTNHSPLNEYLHSIGVRDSGTCPCGMAVETAQHFLFECRNWTQEREELRAAMGERWADLSYALGGWSGRRSRITEAEVDGPRHTWKPNIQVIKALIKFTKSTQRFHPKALIEQEGDGQRQ